MFHDYNLIMKNEKNKIFIYSSDDLKSISTNMLDYAMDQGISQASVDVTEDQGLSSQVRLGQIETSEHSREKSAGITVYNAGKKGYAETSSFDPSAIQQTVKKAMDIATFTEGDSFSGLPEKKDLETNPRDDLELFHPWKVSLTKATEIALRAENAAFAVDKKIKNSDGACVTVHHSNFYSLNSSGFEGGYQQSRHSISIAPIAKKGDEMERDFWYSSDRNYNKLSTPEDIGVYAAERALSRLGSRKISTRKAPVLFDAPIASSLLGSFVQALSGGALYKNLTFLDKSIGEQVFPPSITITEDPFIKGALSSAPFDDEGVKVCKRNVVDEGVVLGYFLSSYSARRLSMKNTGHAGGSHNLKIHESKGADYKTLDDLFKLMNNGLFVTELMGQGVNPITGDYSRGASGFWIKNGRIAFPVYEITIAGNLREMYRD
ncbi:MAG: metalloprotease PmbA, partial [Proteobacteria bacterium]|nr:metalloprotease PmbA [Pseudomonadota bacterium]